ncbi:MAG: hypothetical protein ACP5T3_02985 [Candidatus Micrarchaeia archaeon]
MADQEAPGGQAITTSIDDLVKYLGDHGETDSLTLAKDLGVPETIVETWANVLEKANIVHVSYKVGRMYISKAVSTPQEEATIRQNVVAKQQVITNDIVSQTQMLNDIAARIDQFKKYMADVENVYNERAGTIKQVMDRINAYDEELNRMQSKINEGADYIAKFRGKVEQEIASINDKTALLDSLTKGTGLADAQKLVDDMNAKLSLSRQELERSREAFEKQLEEERRHFIELDEDIRKEAKLLESFVAELKNQVADYASEMSNYSKEAQSINKQVNSEAKRLLDEAAKAEQEAKGIYAAAQKDASSLSATLVDIKNKFPEIAKLEDTLTDIKRDMADAEAEKDMLSKELAEMQQQLEALKAMGEGELGKKSETLINMEQSLKKVTARSSKLGKKVSGISDKTKRLGSGE